MEPEMETVGEETPCETVSCEAVSEVAVPEVAAEVLPDMSAAVKPVKEPVLPQLKTSRILGFPMTRQKKDGFTDHHLFVWISEDGYLAASSRLAITKLENDKNCRPVFSFSTAEKDQRIVSVFEDGTLSMGTLKPVMEKKNNDKFFPLHEESKRLLFAAPVSSGFGLLVITHDTQNRRYFRLLNLAGFTCGVNVRGRDAKIFNPENLTLDCCEVLTKETVKQLGNDYEAKFETEFDINLGGKYWQNNASVQDLVDELKTICKLEI